MARYNAQLQAVALEKLSRLSKAALVPADAQGIMPAEPGGPGGPGAMPPGGGDGGPPPPPEGGPPPGGPPPPGMEGGPPPPGMEGGPPPGGPPPGAGGDPLMEQLSQVNSKLDQLMGVLNGFLMGQQAAGGGKGSGSGGGQQELLKQIAGAMGIQTDQPPAGGGMALGGAPAGGPLQPVGAGMPNLGMPGAGGGMAPPGAEMKAAEDRQGNGKTASPADRVSRLFRALDR